MAKREEGEYILELGNRQLLSMVFIIMVLFGIVFSLGYFMGRNSAPEAAASEPPARPPAAEPAPPPAAEQAEAPAPASTPVPPPPEQPLEPGQARVATATAAAAPPPAPPAAADAKAPPQTPPATAAKPAPQQSVETASDEPLLPPPPAGQTFLQVAAVKRPEAELIVDVLKKKGFNAMVAPGPSDTLYRVLVGPLKDAAAVGKAKSDLEAIGFKSSYPRKY